MEGRGNLSREVSARALCVLQCLESCGGGGGVGNGFPLLIQERFSRIKGAVPWRRATRCPFCMVMLRQKAVSSETGVGVGTETDQGQVEIGDQMHYPCFDM